MSDQQTTGDVTKEESPYREEIEEARRVIREDWPEWMRHNVDAVHVPIRRDGNGRKRSGDE